MVWPLVREDPTYCCCCIASVVSDSVRPHRRQPTGLPHPWDSPGKNTEMGCHFLLQCINVKRDSEVAQSWPTLSDPMDCSLLGSSVHGSFQARVLEWGAIAFSDPTCYRATQPVCHYWAQALEPMGHNWAQALQLLKPACQQPVLQNKRKAAAMRRPWTAMKSSPHSLQLEKAQVQQRRATPPQPKYKEIFLKKTIGCTY